MIDKLQVVAVFNLFRKFNDYRILLSYQSQEAIASTKLSMEKADESFEFIKKWCAENNQVGNERVYASGFRCGEIIDLRNPDFQILPMGFFESNFESKKEYLAESINQIHLWNLAWCFEKYEMLLKEVYITIGKLDYNYWLTSDFGNAKMEDISNGTWQEFSNQILQNQKYDANTLRKRFISISPSILENEKPRFFEYNYFWYIAYITQLRHHIVHTHGQIFSIDRFFDKIRQMTGQNNNDTFEKFLAQFSGMCLRQNGDTFSINLIDNTPETKSSKFQALSQHLGNHAYLLVTSICQVLDARAV